MNIVYNRRSTGYRRGRNGRARLRRTRRSRARPSRRDGGSGNGTNPEQLFAAGYDACFHSALQLSRGRPARRHRFRRGARVGIGPTVSGGFGLAVTLEVSLPHLERGEALALTERRTRCGPYSNATRGNIEVTLTVADDE
ncbi:Ohr family peroxiredoxin [Rhodococcus hoagii]|nr:Ohr family peroxiredoxin [Prescottella equi]